MQRVISAEDMRFSIGCTIMLHGNVGRLVGDRYPPLEHAEKEEHQNHAEWNTK
jgi:hypothetical protein